MLWCVTLMRYGVCDVGVLLMRYGGALQLCVTVRYDCALRCVTLACYGSVLWCVKEVCYGAQRSVTAVRYARAVRQCVCCVSGLCFCELRLCVTLMRYSV